MAKFIRLTAKNGMVREVLLGTRVKLDAHVHGGDKPGHWIVGGVPMRAV